MKHTSYFVLHRRGQGRMVYKFWLRPQKLGLFLFYTDSFPLSSAMHFLSLFLICSNSHASEWDALYRQQVLLGQFFRFIAPEFIERRSHDQSFADFCQWATDADFAVDCTDAPNILSTIGIRGFNDGNFSTGYLPNSVQMLSIIRCRKRYVLQTRTLPLGLISASFMDNHIFGTVDLQHLPPHTVYFDISRNSIIGPIWLDGLPEAIAEIDLAYNCIRQYVLYVEDIPETLKWVSLCRNKVREVQFTREELVDKAEISIGRSSAEKSKYSLRG